MLIGILNILLIIPLVILFTVGIPIIIGVCVYRDASRRVDCSPLLWALVAALVPSCIGLVIYLIVRRDYPLKDGSGSTYQYQDIDNLSGSGEDRGGSGFPTWAKALLIIGAVIAVICIVALVITVMKVLFGIGGESIAYYRGY
ncbi:MAG: hypothetical protein ACI4LA_04200 [Emergencia sp.]